MGRCTAWMVPSRTSPQKSSRLGSCRRGRFRRRCSLLPASIMTRRCSESEACRSPSIGLTKARWLRCGTSRPWDRVGPSPPPRTSKVSILSPTANLCPCPRSSWWSATPASMSHVTARRDSRSSVAQIVGCSEVGLTWGTNSCRKPAACSAKPIGLTGTRVSIRACRRATASCSAATTTTCFVTPTPPRARDPGGCARHHRASPLR
mmetsp:Transcript_87537/g.250787  ORF Transcript_87537/g.250787 Transcript_87537/m.250787 type:complete len:206 (+) Transcript_87537:248-865(+)